MKGAKELMINEANKLNESNAEIQHLKGALGTQVRRSWHHCTDVIRLGYKDAGNANSSKRTR